MKKDKNLKYRSPEIQAIVGKVPIWVIRWGMSVIFIVLILILFLSWVIKYPETVLVEVKIKREGSVLNDKITLKEGKYYAEALISEKDFVKIKEGQIVKIKLKGYSYYEYGLIKGIIIEKEDIPINSKYLIKINFEHALKTSFCKKVEYYEGMSGEAEIMVKDTRLFDMILKKFKRN